MSIQSLNSPRLRAMQPSDIEAVAALAHRADPYGWTVRNFQDALASGNRVELLTARRSDEEVLLGYFVTMLVIDEAELLEIAVDPVWQGRGYGKKLLAAAMKSAENDAARVMHLEVRESNARARKMYLSAGFAEVGSRRNYYPADQGREDAVLMTVQFM